MVITPPVPTRRPIARVIAAATVAVLTLLAACGGSNDRCNDSTGLSFSVSWTVNGVVNQAFIRGRVGQPLIADPVYDGLPSSCIGKVTVRLPFDALPKGLTLDSSTGRISGTATEPKSLRSSTILTLQPEGYFEANFPFGIFITP